jgi:hypothetical protein
VRRAFDAPDGVVVAGEYAHFTRWIADIL